MHDDTINHTKQGYAKIFFPFVLWHTAASGCIQTYNQSNEKNTVRV